MKSVAEVLEELKDIDVGVQCRKCGSVPMLVGKQYSVRCPSCGINISCSPNYLAALKEAEYKARNTDTFKKHLCSICEDTGVVILEEQLDGQLQEFGYRCLCRAGARKEDLSGWPVVPATKVMQRRAILEGEEIDVTF